MKVNKATQLWEELRPDEVSAMTSWAEDVVLRGKVAYPDPPWLTLWYSELGFDEDRQRLMLQSTAVPQKVLLSIVKALDSEVKRLEATPLVVEPGGSLRVEKMLVTSGVGVVLK
jgi:hypothetical protein